MALIDAIGDGPVALDSVIFIYFIEKSAIPSASAVSVLAHRCRPADRGDLREYSARNAGRALSVRRYLAETYEAILTDALQLAAASLTKCTAFLTNDRRIPSLAGLQVLQLDEFVEPPPG